jgi:hypothetical protein
MKTGEIPTRCSNSGLPIVQLSAGSAARSPRHRNMKAFLRAATTRLATLLVDLILDVILWFMTDNDAPSAVLAPIGQPQAGDRHA